MSPFVPLALLLVVTVLLGLLFVGEAAGARRMGRVTLLQGGSFLGFFLLMMVLSIAVQFVLPRP